MCARAGAVPRLPPHARIATHISVAVCAWGARLGSLAWELILEACLSAVSLAVSLPPSPPGDDFCDDPDETPEMFDEETILILIMILLFHNQMQQQTILVLMVTMISMVTMSDIAMRFFTNPGYRQFWGVPALKRHGERFSDTVERMMKPGSEGGNPAQFYKLFRMWPATFEYFVTFLWAWVQDMRDADRAARGISAGRHPDYAVFRVRLLMTIFFLAHGCTLAMLGVIWDKPNVNSSYLLLNEIASTRDYFIRWPTGEYFYQAMNSFSKLLSRCREQEFGFARCIGAIDGTFCRILRPGAYSHDGGLEHNSYKKYYAIQLLAVCLPNLLFTYAHVGTPGSRADTTMLKNSNLYLRLDDYIPPGSGAYLLGDSGFSLLLWILIPFTDRAYRTINFFRKQIVTVYDAAQKSARVVIEQAYGVLKGRWRILHTGIHLHLPMAPIVVDCCVILHNVCIIQKDLWSLGSSPRCFIRQDDDGQTVFTDPDRGFTLPTDCAFISSLARPPDVEELHTANSTLAQQFRNEVAYGLAPSLRTRQLEQAHAGRSTLEDQD